MCVLSPPSLIGSVSYLWNCVVISHYSLVIWFCSYISENFFSAFIAYFYFFCQPLKYWWSLKFCAGIFSFLNLSPLWPSDSLWWLQWQSCDFHPNPYFHTTLLNSSFIYPTFQLIFLLPCSEDIWHTVCLASVSLSLCVYPALPPVSPDLTRGFQNLQGRSCRPSGSSSSSLPLLSKFPV